MREPPNWYWDEYQQVGVDYEDIEEVRKYDERMSRFRDFDAENRRAIEAIALTADDVLLEIGCGTAQLTRAAARVCRRVFAYDVSQAMLDYATERAAEEELTNVVFRRGGFLDCHAGEAPVDVVVTQVAMHHIPDFWKALAIRRIAAMLRPGGRLLLRDVAFDLDLPEENDARIAAWIDALPEDSRENGRRHIATEYSTMTWVLEGMLERAGLKIERRTIDEKHSIAEYVCRRGDRPAPCFT